MNTKDKTKGIIKFDEITEDDWNEVRDCIRQIIVKHKCTNKNRKTKLSFKMRRLANLFSIDISEYC